MPADKTTVCIFGANVLILAQIHYQLSRPQADFAIILCQHGQNEGSGWCHNGGADCYVFIS